MSSLQVAYPGQLEKWARAADVASSYHQVAGVPQVLVDPITKEVTFDIGESAVMPNRGFNPVMGNFAEPLPSETRQQLFNYLAQ